MPDIIEFSGAADLTIHEADVNAHHEPFAEATQPLNSKGNSFSTIQAAIDDLAGSGWIYVPSGTFNEAILISNNDVILFGAGWSTIINGGTTGHAIEVTGDRCVIRDLECKTTIGGGRAFDGIRTNGDNTIIEDVFVNGSDQFCVVIGTSAPNSYIKNSLLIAPDDTCISIGSSGAIFSNNICKNAGIFGVRVTSSGDNAVIDSNLIDTTGDDGVNIDTNGENCIVDGNRITNWTNEAIDDNSGTSTIGDNETT